MVLPRMISVSHPFYAGLGRFDMTFSEKIAFSHAALGSRKDLTRYDDFDDFRKAMTGADLA
jgi:hypothetical protein